MKRILRIGLAMLAALLLMNACDVEKEPYVIGAEYEKYILVFQVDSIYGLVDENAKVVKLDFPAGTDVTHLTPTITISNYATIEPESGVAQDFTNPVYYTVTAMNGSTVQYMVEAIVHDADNEKSILRFYFEELDCEGLIYEVTHQIDCYVPAETDVTALVPVIEVSEGASVSPASGEPQDFTDPVVYTVTAQNGTTAEYTVSVIVEGDDVVPTGKTVLIKDFTGARCVNCPAAAEYVHNLQHQLDEDHIFIMSVHAGFQAQPVGQFPDFLTDEGTVWYNNHDSNPLFAVDHVALTDGNTLSVEQVDAPLAAALVLEDQTFEILVDPRYDEATRQLQVAVRTVAMNELDGQFYITVCLVEDNIIGWQTVPGGIDKEYVFRNVFRGTLNGAYGEEFEGIHVNMDDNYYCRYSTEIDADYNADECYLMVYVYDKSQGDKILQTAVKKIK